MPPANAKQRFYYLILEIYEGERKKKNAKYRVDLTLVKISHVRKYFHLSQKNSQRAL